MLHFRDWIRPAVANSQRLGNNHLLQAPPFLTIVRIFQRAIELKQGLRRSGPKSNVKEKKYHQPLQMRKEGVGGEVGELRPLLTFFQ